MDIRYTLYIRIYINIYIYIIDMIRVNMINYIILYIYLRSMNHGVSQR